MPTNKIIKTDSSMGYGPSWAGLRVDTSDTTLVYNADGTERVVVSTALAQTLTNKTFTSPTLTTPVINGAVTGTQTIAFVTPAAISFAGVVPSTETTGSLITTGATWVSHSAVGGCAVKLLCQSTALTGEYATLRIRGASTPASQASGEVEGVNSSASARANDYADLYGVFASAQPDSFTQASASNICSALRAKITATASSSGRRWVGWFDTTATTKASGGDYLMRISHNGTIANDGCFTIYNGGRMPVLFNFEDAAGFLTDAGSPGTTAAGYIAVKTPAGTKYISLFTA